MKERALLCLHGKLLFQVSSSIGIIEQEEERYHVVSSKTNHSLYSKTLESAINELLSYFTLHEK